jgi:hypothetical protein
MDYRTSVIGTTVSGKEVVECPHCYLPSIKSEGRESGTTYYHETGAVIVDGVTVMLNDSCPKERPSEGKPPIEVEG